jgi:ligand-binding sensor domain-containing protein
MKKLKVSFQWINIISIVILLVGTSSCNGQKNKTDLGDETKASKIKSIPISKDEETTNKNHLNAFQLSNFDNQISDVVRTIFQDSKGIIWFGTQSGVFRTNGKSLIHIDSIKDELGHGVTIKAITEDKDGKIWFGHTGGISVFNGESFSNYYEKDGLLSNDVWCISVDKKNHIWIGTIEGVCTFDGSHFTAFEIPEGKIDPTRGISSTKMIHDIMEDRQGRIWFSTNGGVYIKDFDLLHNISEKDGLKTNFVNQVIEDKNGSFWISTSKGLFHYTDKSLKNITKGLRENFKGTGSILQDSSGNIWFNSNLRDIYSFNGEHFSKYRIAEGEYGPAPFQIYEDQQKRLWFVGFGGAYRFENEKFINITQNGPF